MYYKYNVTLHLWDICLIFHWIDSNINSWVSNGPSFYFFSWQIFLWNFSSFRHAWEGNQNPILSNWCGSNRILKISFAIGLIKGLIRPGLFSTVATKPHVAVEHWNVLVWTERSVSVIIHTGFGTLWMKKEYKIS